MAGSGGDRSAVIRALQLDSAQVQIAGVVAGRRLCLQEATLIVCGPGGGLDLHPQPAATPDLREATPGTAKGGSFKHMKTVGGSGGGKGAAQVGVGEFKSG
jgi:hypothetical protein